MRQDYSSSALREGTTRKIRPSEAFSSHGSRKSETLPLCLSRATPPPKIESHLRDEPIGHDHGICLNSAHRSGTSAPPRSWRDVARWVVGRSASGAFGPIAMDQLHRFEGATRLWRGGARW